MHRKYYNVVLVVALLEYISSLQACVRSCNYNGICYIENGMEKCKCLDRIYVGNNCDVLVNHCQDNPCKNGGTCIASPGQYNCFCTENVYGQNCTMKSNETYFGQIYLQYNHVASISQDNYFLIILNDLGAVLSMLEMITLDYAIAGGLVVPSQDFVETNDIQTLAQKYGLPSSNLPTGIVFYYLGKYRIGNDGIALATLTITDDTYSNLYYIWYFQFGSTKNAGCNPIIGISNCGSPKFPVHINANQSFFVEASIHRDCGSDSIMSYKWSISNYFDTKTLQSFGDINSRSFKIAAFGIQIKYDIDDIFFFFKAIKLIAMERSADGIRYGEKIIRCYVMVNMEPPIPKISGGEYQEYSHFQEILMDGSESVDLLLHPKWDQNLTYSWKCNSNDENLFCKNLNKTGMFNHSLFTLFWYFVDSH